MRVIGLTGGIGSGKSTVGRLLAASGAVVIDADQVAREVVEPGEPALARIVERFGSGVLDDDGRLDRAALAAIVFTDASARSDLEGITHPAIGGAIVERIGEVRDAEQEDGRERLVVVEHPLLVETGQAASYETLIVVETPIEERLVRLRSRGMADADALARMDAQASDDERREVASHVLENAGSVEDLERRVLALLDELGIPA